VREVLSPQKRERCGDAPLCLSSSRQEEGKTALMLGRVNLFGGAFNVAYEENSKGCGRFRAHAVISYGKAVEH